MSGKQSRKIRKCKGFSKKAVAGAAVALLSVTPLASEGGEFLLSLYPHFSFPVVKFDDSLSIGYGGGLRLTYRPTQFFNVFIQGDYKQYSFDTKQNIGDMTVLGGTVGAGYHLSLTDRLGLDINAGVGYYNATYKKDDGVSKSTYPLNGLNVNGSVSISYKLGPVISVYAEGEPVHYVYKNSKFLTSIDANPGVTVNLTKAFTSKSDIELGESTLKPVFPVFYSWYNDNSFGSVEVINGEDASITDVEVFFYQQQYMSQPQSCGQTKLLKRGEKINVDLKAFFNEQMLSLNEKTDTMSSVIVEYKYLGKKVSKTFPMIVPVYGRNNMSWEDDRCASAFVSSKDPAAMWFAKYVISTIRDDVRSGVPQNIQYAMAIFEALDQFGLNYVKDPTSAFEDNVGTASIDFLQFPYQTLMYRGGDCDDLSILVCSLFESIGIKTAFITIPGHIYMAFDSGLTLQEAQNYFLSMDDLIVDDDKVWVPLEITLTDEGFNKAWYKGSWEWNTAKRANTAMLYRMEDSWQIYKPVNVPGASAKFTLPEETYVSKLFSHSVDEFVMNQITPQVAYYENLLVKAPTTQNYNDFGVLYAKYGLFELAEQQFRMARRTNYIPALINTGNLYYSIKDYSRAENWYKEVLAKDKTNSLAMIGLARCAYEKSDYKTCDYYYAQVYNSNYPLARQYSYLGAFEQTSGRSFSLADRLENTVWVQSEHYTVRSDGTVVLNVEAAAKETVVKQDSQSADNAGGLPVSNTNVAIVPSAKKEGDDSEEEDDIGAGEGGDSGNGTPGEYTGISSQLDFNILTAKDLAMLASDSIESNGETLDDFDADSFSLSVQSDSGIIETFEETEQEEQAVAAADEQSLEPQSVITSVLTDVPVREVPRFTTQPSEEWAPKEAYQAETIPGMRSYEEELGTYQNEKAFLYEDQYSFAVNPGETAPVKPKAKTEPVAAEITAITAAATTAVATTATTATTTAPTTAATTVAEASSSVVLREPQEQQIAPQEPQVAPKGQQIAAQEKQTVGDPEPVEGSQSTSVAAEPSSVAVESTKTKSKVPVIAIIFAAIAGGIAALFGLKRKNKRKGI